MKIALAVFQIKTQGGKERDCLAVAKALIKRGHDVTIVTTAATDEQVESLPLVMLPQRGFSNHDRAANFADAVNAYRKTATPDALVAFERIPGADFFFAADAAAGLRLSGLSRWLPRGRTYLRLERGLFENGKTQFFFLTPRQRAEYAALYPLDPSRAMVLPVILHNERYTAAEAAIHNNGRERLGLPDNAIIAIAVAVKPMQKGLDRSIEALSKFPDIHLISVGSSDRRIKEQAAALGIADRVHVIPYTPSIMEMLAAADFLIHPARVEAAGQVIAESLLAGRPAIVSGLCGYASEIERSGAGVVLPEPFKQTDLDQAVAKMIADLSNMTSAAAIVSQQLQAHRGEWLDVIANAVTSPSKGSLSRPSTIS